MNRTMLVTLAAGSIVFGCGGGSDSSSQLDSLRSQAAAKQAEATALAVDAPCSANSQCAGLIFGATTHNCGALPQIAYLIAAPSSAQAASAAEQQRAIASRVQELLPSDGTACPGVVTPQPPISCSAARCVSGP
jgi:hypothetical protein